MIRRAYEWEYQEVTRETIRSNIYRLKKEIKRISTTTLRGNFIDPADRDYWVKKLKILNGQLNSFEEQLELA